MLVCQQSEPPAMRVDIYYVEISTISLLQTTHSFSAHNFSTKKLSNLPQTVSP